MVFNKLASRPATPEPTELTAGEELYELLKALPVQKIEVSEETHGYRFTSLCYEDKILLRLLTHGQHSKHANPEIFVDGMPLPLEDNPKLMSDLRKLVYDRAARSVFDRLLG